MCISAPHKDAAIEHGMQYLWIWAERAFECHQPGSGSSVAMPGQVAPAGQLSQLALLGFRLYVPATAVTPALSEMQADVGVVSAVDTQCGYSLLCSTPVLRIVPQRDRTTR
jgi:hypothetical protein